MIQSNFSSINYKSLKVFFSILEAKKIFVVGPPGSKLRELSLTLAEYLNFHFVSIGDLIEKELSKKSQLVFYCLYYRANKFKILWININMLVMISLSILLLIKFIIWRQIRRILFLKDFLKPEYKD